MKYIPVDFSADLGEKHELGLERPMVLFALILPSVMWWLEWGLAMQRPGGYFAAAVAAAMAPKGWGVYILDTNGRSDGRSRRPVSHRYNEFSFCDKSCIFITVP